MKKYMQCILLLVAAFAMLLVPSLQAKKVQAPSPLRMAKGTGREPSSRNKSAIKITRAPSQDSKATPSQPINTGVSFNQQISSSSLNMQATTKGLFSINKSGRYFLSSDLSVAPSTSHVAIIYINASDTVLDLGGKSIKLSTTGNITSCRAAIELASGVRNVTIMNGSINGHSLNGLTALRINRGIMNPTSGTTTNVNVLLDGLTMVDCATSAIELRYVNDLSINNITTHGSTDSTIESVTGLSLANCNRGTITNSSFNGTLSAASVYGITATSCSNFTIESVETSNHISTGASATGISLTSCAGFSCEKLKASKNSVQTASTTVAGILLSGSTDNAFTDCLANNNACTANVANVNVYGFSLTSTSNGNNFTSCQANGNTGGGTGSTAGVTAGVSINASNYNVFKDSKAMNNSACTAHGFRSSNSCTGTSIINCIASGNSSASTATADVYGIAFYGETGGLVQGCDVRTNVHTGTNRYAYGIALLNTCSRCTVESNSIFSNRGYDGTRQYGYYDGATDSTTFLRKNVSFGHGGILSNGNKTLSDSGAMNYFFQYSEGSSMSVQNLIKEADISNMDAFDSSATSWYNFSIVENVDSPEPLNTTNTSFPINQINLTSVSSPNINCTTTYSITTSGSYYLIDNITISPCSTAGGYAAIYINSDNVILNMNNKALSVTTTGLVPGGTIYGIHIAAGKKNISIANGLISGRGMTTNNIYAGIYIPGSLSSPNDNISIKGLRIANCKQYGLYASYCNNMLLDDVQALATTSITAGNNPAGIFLSSCNDGVIQNSWFNETSLQANSTQSTAYGFYASLCNNFALKQTTASSNDIRSINTTARSGVYGIYLTQCKAFNCTQITTQGNKHLGINTNSTEGNECCGIFLNNTTGCIFDRCQSNNNSGGYQYGSNYTCSTYGFKLTNSSDGNIFTSCEATSNIGAADTAGIFIGQSGHNIFESCYSFNNTSSKTNFGSRFAFGFTTTFGTNNMFKSCKATGNRVATRVSNKGYGFAMRTEVCSTIRSCDINCNGTISTSAAGEGYGIACLGHCTRCVIKYNYLSSNCGLTKMYGFKDFATYFKGFLQANIAFGHGVTLSNAATLTDTGAMNYFLVFNPAGTGNPDVRKLFRDSYNDDMNNFAADSIDSYNFSITEN